METMNYKILINSKGVPVLINTFDSTIHDESKHIPFKDYHSVVELLWNVSPSDYASKNAAIEVWLVDRIGQTFDLPDNVGVSFEEEQYIGSETENSFTIGYKKLAILTPKENSAHSFTEGMDVPDVTIKPVYTSETKLKVEPVSEGTLTEEPSDQKPPEVVTQSEKGAKQTISFPMDLKDAKIKEICWALDREIWAKVESHEATQSWGREQSAKLILEYFGSVEELRKESNLRQSIIDGQRKTLSEQWAEIEKLKEYSLLERSMAREEVIQECIEIVKKCGGFESHHIAAIRINSVAKELEKLKSRQ